MTPTFFADAGAFRAWLQLHAAGATELLVGFHKVGSRHPCMSWSESVDEALGFGWIDGRRKRIDDDAYSIRFTPRKASERERFQRDQAAWDYFQAAPPGYRKTILHWIMNAKREETRSKRLEQLMQACAAGRRLT